MSRRIIRDRTRRLRCELLMKDDTPAHSPDWFESIYRKAQVGLGEPSWAMDGPNRQMVGWREFEHVASGSSVVGCGYGHDAAWLQSRGLAVTAFDISQTAVASAKNQHPGLNGHLLVADVATLPFPSGTFELVVEVYTLQCLSRENRRSAVKSPARVLANGASLLVVGTLNKSRTWHEDAPWTLTLKDFSMFEGCGLVTHRLERVRDETYPHLTRVRASYERQW